MELIDESIQIESLVSELNKLGERERERERDINIKKFLLVKSPKDQQAWPTNNCLAHHIT
jgi:hypothetical protein